MTERDAAGTEDAADSEGATDIEIESDDSEGTGDTDANAGDDHADRDGGERSGTESGDGSAAIASEVEDVDEITERVADASDEGVAREIADLNELVADLEARLDEGGNGGSDDQENGERIEELQSQLARTQADFRNYKKRMDRRREEERERATEDLVTRLLGVRDDLVRALSQDADAEIRGGVESTLSEFDRVLDDEGVAEISPEPGTETDPQRHEAMMRVNSEYPEGAIAEVFRPGYEMSEKVLRPAQITVSEGDSREDGSDDE